MGVSPRSAGVGPRSPAMGNGLIEDKEVERIICVDHGKVTMNPWHPETDEQHILIHGKDLLATDWMVYGPAGNRGG
jgi:hypothetical protein